MTQNTLAFTKKSSFSRVITTSLYSKCLGMDWNYDLYLPNSCLEDTNERYPLLLMLHGIMGNDRNLLERFDSQVILDAVLRKTHGKMIVAFLDGFNSFYINQQGGLQMESAIMSDLLPQLLAQYPVATAADQHAIGGISMGGYGAARLALKYPQSFRHAILISPAVWEKVAKDNPIRVSMHAFTNQQLTWSDQVYQQNFPTSYLHTKDADSINFFVESTQDDTTVPMIDVIHFVEALEHHKISTTFINDKGDNHNWNYWRKTVPNAYMWAIQQFEQIKKA